MKLTNSFTGQILEGTMLEFFAQYFLFLLETITIIAGILVVLITLFALIAKQRRNQEDEELEINCLNDKFDNMHGALQETILSKDEFKKWLKAKKKQDKNLDKNPKSKRVYVIDFDGDVRASAVEELREMITAILTQATKNDEVLIKIDDEFVKSYSPNGNYEIKWESFSSYRICDNLILLNINTGMHSALIIDKRLINNEEMNHLLNIIDKKRILKLN